MHYTDLFQLPQRKDIVVTSIWHFALLHAGSLQSPQRKDLVIAGEWDPALLQMLIREHIPESLQLLLSNPLYHNPVWHEFSLMQHIHMVIEAAKRMLLMTGIDVVIPAAFHDLGKLLQFESAVTTGNYQFAGHEDLSVQIAQEYGQDSNVQFLVLYHDIPYQHRTDRIFLKLCKGDVDKLRHLLTMAACDTAGKGWTKAQHTQRPEIATKFQWICEDAGLDPAFTEVIQRACLEW